MHDKAEIVSNLMNRANESERNLVACVLLKPKEIFNFPWLRQDHFTNPKYSQVFDIVSNMLMSNTPIDTASICEELKKRGSDLTPLDVLDMMSHHGVSTTAPYHADNILKFHTLKRLTDVADSFYMRASKTDIDTDTIISDALHEVVDVSKEIDKKSDETVGDSIDALQSVRNISIQKKNAGDDTILGIPCGFSKIDKVIDGLRPGHLWVVGGYTSSGKTFFALNVLSSVIEQKKKAMFISLEMTAQDIISRLASIVSGVSCRDYVKGNISNEEDIIRIQDAFQTIKDSSLTIHNGSFDRIKLAILQKKLSQGLDVVFIDYIQLIRTAREGEKEAMDLVSQELQALAIEHNITIVAISQVSNEHAKNQQATDIIGFKGSGAIAASADLAIELINPDKPEERQQKSIQGIPYTVEAVIKKNRHGSIGKITMEFVPNLGRFFQANIQDFDTFIDPPEPVYKQVALS